VTGVWERYRGDTYVVVHDPDWRGVRTADNPDEVRVRATLDWVREPAVTGLSTSMRMRYEHVTPSPSPTGATRISSPGWAWGGPRRGSGRRGSPALFVAPSGLA
jgi:hypothetical protein